jgi:hypothetical protein
MMVATVWLAMPNKQPGGLFRRAPNNVSNAAFRYMRSLDTEEELVPVPFFCEVNDKRVTIDWNENPPDMPTEEELAADWEDYDDGRCAKCGRLEGDHLIRGGCQFQEKRDRPWWIA